MSNCQSTSYSSGIEVTAHLWGMSRYIEKQLTPNRDPSGSEVEQEIQNQHDQMWGDFRHGEWSNIVAGVAREVFLQFLIAIQCWKTF